MRTSRSKALVRVASAGVSVVAVALALLLGELWARIGAVLLITGAALVAAWVVVELRAPGSPRVRRGLRYLARLALVLSVLRMK